MTVESDRDDNGRPVPFTDDVTARIPVQRRPELGPRETPAGIYPAVLASPAGAPAANWAAQPPQLPVPQPAVASQKRHSISVWPLILAAVVTALVLLILIVGLALDERNSGPSTMPTSAPIANTPAAPAVASTESAPATTAAPAPAAPAPKTYTGKGDDVISIEKPASVAIMTFSCPKCTSNTVVKSDGGEGLLVNTIGAYTGKRWLDIRDGSTTTQLTIKAKGAWTVTIGDLDQATKASGPVSGSGDDVILLSGGTATAAVTNRGESNFAVHVLSTTDLDLAINEIGSYTGTVPMSAPALVQVTSDGDWSITPQ